MLEEYIYHGRQKLRCGYTTGSCAAAASGAAVEMLLSGDAVKWVDLLTPKGINIHVDVLDITINHEYASCAVQKDGGDDPDITSGILIYARAERIADGIEITGGKGVGIVMQNGLDQPKGSPAINSTPRKMIACEVNKACEKFDYHGGIKITIYVPCGAELAAKTYNPRMGIEGGISIIGTSGIVEPMSNAALIDTIRLEEKMRRAEGIRNLLLTLGNYGEDFLSERMPYCLEKSVKCSNFIGEAIDSALEYGFESILIVGHIGKLVKLGAGIMNTHSAQADGRMDVLITCGVLAGVESSYLKRIAECVTVDGALEILNEANAIEKTAEILMQKTQYYLNAKVKNSVKIGAMMFSNKFGIIGATPSADELIKAITEEYNG